MYKYLTVEEYLADRSQPLRDTGEALRLMIGEALPQAEASLWHGAPTWKLGRTPVVLVKAYTRHLTLSFFRGARFEDPSGRLVPSGSGQMAGVKIRSEEDLDVEVLAGWLTQAGALQSPAGA